jgi:type VI secretion system protein ImpA
MAIVESRAPVIDLEALLRPISEDRPSGESLQYSGVYDEIREARYTDPFADLSQGQWQTETKVADYPKVIRLAVAALASETKDLQIAVWLTEALTKQHGFVGLRDSLILLRRLQEEFWETLHPEIDEGDMEGRANAIEWMEQQTALAVKMLPITDGSESFNYINWLESRDYDFPENIDALDYHEQEAIKVKKAQAEEEKRKTGDMWRAAKARTNRAFCEDLNLTLEECWTQVQELDRINEEKYDRNQTPGLRNLKKSLEDIRSVVKPLLEEKRQQEPDEIEEETVTVENGDGTVVQVRAGGAATGAIQSRADALKRLAEISDYFKKNEPHSPVSYLVQRAVKWGHMPLENWLQDVIKDENVIFQLRQTLGFNTQDPNAASAESSEY